MLGIVEDGIVKYEDVERKKNVEVWMRGFGI